MTARPIFAAILLLLTLHLQASERMSAEERVHLQRQADEEFFSWIDDRHKLERAKPTSKEYDELTESAQTHLENYTHLIEILNESLEPTAKSPTARAL